MSGSGSLTSTSLRADLLFNWVFLIELLVCGILTLFFLFYFNRVFATIISYALRAWTWHKYRVYIDIQSLQISLLGGRIFVRGFRYHGNNETILIHSGYVTWCYWLRNVRDVDLDQGRDLARKPSSEGNADKEVEDASNVGEEEGGVKQPRKTLCRVSVSLEGVEWFVYNRSVAYDSVIAGLTREDVGSSESIFRGEGTEVSDKRPRNLRRGDSEKSALRDENPPDPEKTRSASTDQNNTDNPSHDEKKHENTWVSQDDESESRESNSPGAFILRFLPVHINLTKAAVVLGNENTKSVLITKVDAASGEIGASKSTNLDQYRQLINFEFKHPVLQIKPNDDYKEDQTTAASRIKRGDVDQPKSHHVHTHSFLHRQRRRAWHTLQDLVPAFRSSVESVSSNVDEAQGSSSQNASSNRWQGLSRYLDEGEQDGKAKWSSIEYATVSSIVDSSEATMSFYWDVVGVVPHRSTMATSSKREKHYRNINGDISPEWGINLFFRSATINYGPWADRQRADLQRVFFPGLCKDVSPARDLVPGQFRVPTEFKLHIEFDEETTIRIPIKEESKNWKWAKQADTMGARPGAKKRNGRGRKKKPEKGAPGPEIRPFGWLDVKVGSNATITYLMDMVAGAQGFSNKLTLDLPHMEITTSVNHGLLWRSGENHIACDLSNPLEWNTQRNWKFEIASKGLELFILREHIFLLIDLVDDWASGPPPEYLTFTPFQYLVNLQLEDFKLYLNVNDSNIINNPSDLDDNSFMILCGLVLTADIAIPLEHYRPHLNVIPFDVTAKQLSINLHVPPWNTQATFLKSSELATLKDLVLNGKYQYCATTATSNTDTLLLTLHGTGLSALFYGFVVRYYLKIKDNYFGDDIRFKTLEEYQEVLNAKREGLEEVPNSRPPHKKSNDLDVILAVAVVDSAAILPSNLYTAKNHIRIEIAALAADLRFTNYYMDLEVILNTLAFSQDREEDGTTTPLSSTSSPQLFIDGISASGNRLFGLPPTEPTYVCNWDFGVGAVKGETTTEFINRLANGAKALAFSFDDQENALPSISEEVLHDITFLRASLNSIHIWLHVEETAFLLSTGSISIDFNDWAKSHYSKKLHLTVPDLHLGCVDAESASRHRSRTQHPVETHALIQTTVTLGMLERKLGFTEDRQLQQEHVKRHDQRTHRTDFLLHHEMLDDSMIVPVDPPAMCVPLMPLPIDQGNQTRLEERSMRTKSSSRHRQRVISRKSSFLSISAKSEKSDASILHRHSPRKAMEPRNDNTRSRSLHAGSSIGRRISMRELSASTGRQSSFYSATGEQRGAPPSSVTFSSSCMPPYFPLEGVEPDLKLLPERSTSMSSQNRFPNVQSSLDDISPESLNENAAYVSLMLEFPAGISGFFTPNAARAVSSLLDAVQAVDPVDLLDVLQMDSINEVFDLNKQKMSEGKVSDFGVRTPVINLRFLNSSVPTDSQSTHREMYDQYDLSISELAVTSRSEVLLTSSEVIRSSPSLSRLHVSLGSVELAAKERCGSISDTQVIVTGILSDMTFWIVFDDETSANVAFQDLKLVTASNKVEYLASLIHRTESLGSELTELFSSRHTRQCNRVRLFTYLVATTGQQTADPLFLTRPSYVLRSAPNHLRTNDSWKTATRLHHMYCSLGNDIQQDITMRCVNLLEKIPENARQRVLASFDQWRRWDLTNANSCLLMAKIYGPLDAPSTPALEAKPWNLSIRTEEMQLVVDPGPKQNEVSFSDISASIKRNTSESMADIDPQTNNTMILNTLAQVFCADVAINLKWELCELVEDILQLFNDDRTQSEPPNETIPTIRDEPAITIQHITHVLVATDKGSITVDTINIRTTSICQGLKASFVMVNNEAGALSKTSILMLASDAATSNLQSHGQDISLYQLRFPSVHFSYEEKMVETTAAKVLSVAGNCQELSFILQQDVLALIALLDLVISDEVSQLHQLTENIPNGQSPTRETASITGPTSSTKVNIALFLDQYHISVPLLHSLIYKVSGVVARASIAAQLGSEVFFDFDVKEHAHDIQTIVADRPSSISLFQMPPTNGRVTAHMSDDENIVSMFASVKPIVLDAAAIHSLMTALNKPEISSVIHDVKEDIKLVQTHIEEIFDHSKKAPKPRSQKGAPFIYDAHLTLAGFDVFLNAQATDKSHKTARVDLNLGCIQFVVANRLEQDGPVLEFPELRLSLRHIMFELCRWNNNIMEPCGELIFGAFLTASSKKNDTGAEVRYFHLKSSGLEINLFADTASSVVDVIGHLQDKIRDLDLSREKNYLRKLRKSKPRIAINDDQETQEDNASGASVIFASMYFLELLNIQVSWLVGTYMTDRKALSERENLVLSLKRIDLSTRKENTARLEIVDLQLQMVPNSQTKKLRSLNSALLPNVIFNVGYVSTADTRRLAFQAAGKSLDLRLTSQFILPASELKRSIESAADKVQAAAAIWSKPAVGPPTEITRRQPFFGKKRMESLLVDADFAGAVVYLSGKTASKPPDSSRGPQNGKYGQFTHTDSGSFTTLRAPGLAWKVEYKDNGLDDPSLNAEVKVDASKNEVYPSIVPLIMEISTSVKEMVSEDDRNEASQLKVNPQKFMSADEDNILTADPSAVLGRTRLNLGLRICRQEFSLSCQPIARVAATARFDDIYITINTVRSTEHGHFFAASAAFTRLQASVQHVYSRESTGSFDVDSIFLSLMNSKHVSGTSGLSAILKISPMKVLVNAKQLQDFLLFREIWVPPEIRQTSTTPTSATTSLQSQTFLVQRYQQVAATGAFPWNATVSIAELDVQLDLGQAIGKSAFMISNFWISSKKNSDWEQNLCLGFEKVGVDCTGRMSGFVALEDFKMRTSIQWPAREMALNQTPRIQASLGFRQLRIKAAFDYQAFLIADITSFEFLMYNVRNSPQAKGDRLVAILDGEAVQIFCTTTSASQALALYQAFQKLVQEKRSNYEASLSEIENFMKRKSSSQPSFAQTQTSLPTHHGDKIADSPISLHTDVIVTLKAVNVGAYPQAFSDHQIFKLEALNAQARFAATMDKGKIHSNLGLTLGQLRIGLAGVKRLDMPKSVGEISVEDVVSSATGSRGGTILKVPQVQATMQTWQSPGSSHIDYIFKSAFEGKVEVGWNYSRIGYIRTMWATHSKALAQRLGKPLPPSAVKITGVPSEEDEGRKVGEQQKITAEVNVPQSRYDYTAVEPPIIETPQLRDMGEATPPLEWIGLHRDRLPNLTHQIVIVTLLELASEVEDAYGKILGSS